MHSTCDKGAEALTPIEQCTINVPYKKMVILVEVHKYNLWTCVTEVLDNNLLAPHFEWDAQKIFQCNGKCPRLICLIPKGNLHNSGTAQQGHKAMQTYKTVSKNAGEKELKEYGLHRGENVFYDIKHLDIHDALSFDHLHFCHSGLFGWHFLPELQKIIKYQALMVTSLFRFDQIPCWQNLNHFDSAIDTSFSDGNKLFNMSKQILFAAHNLLTPRMSPEGYALFWLIQSYLEVNCYIGLGIHMKDTIKASKEEFARFNNLLEEYIDISDKSMIPILKKDWNFSKSHYFKHVFEDIQNKGATCNYSTWTNKGVHALLKAAYGCNNGKGIADQIMRVNQHCLAVDLILGWVIEYKANTSQCNNLVNSNERPRTPQASMTIEALQAKYSGDIALQQLQHAHQIFTNLTLPNISSMEAYKAHCT
ncbi:hypothetical protein CONPUDRAFT_75332 [Coniophora puteana RWD-64-598 SS2]|uniref:Uncharacterized protein n=1 Tax=Coniophora puteana (strain RWD-64-598) TaxID=741705 RepID=A0A5M3MI60_CONPW|nr:uncharacterized protein CONPUDRAFT_75332 [Coniophora puteana RWD-64-598 SS2]EIW78727.1 hypothetical protein CONPUDRAFT_75332 [Coniophora puteana RWD-64-598 SS2]